MTPITSQAEARAISVRNVDMAVWLEFRVEALRRGLQLNDALAEAARLWLARSHRLTARQAFSIIVLVHPR